MEIGAGESQDEASQPMHHGLRRRSFDVLLRCFANSLGADTATLFARDEQRGTHVAAAWTRDRLATAMPERPDSLVERALAGNGALVDSTVDANGHQRHRAVAAAFSSDQRVVGAIHAGFDRPASASFAQLIWSADLYAGLAALCMSRDAALSDVLGSASYDALTGCLDRTGTDEVLDAEIERSRRRGHPLSCCMIDLDRFKQINDNLGHVEGDRVLAATGAALRCAVRRYDAVGRLGGDEFIVVLPETAGHGSRDLGQRFRRAIRSGVAEATGIQVDASVGAAEWNGQAAADDLVRAADESMRAAKARGGGRVEADEGSSEVGSDRLVELTRHLTRPWS
jgi:diguanylate cyclase (GGDEF)-like protein